MQQHLESTWNKHNPFWTKVNFALTHVLTGSKPKKTCGRLFPPWKCFVFYGLLASDGGWITGRLSNIWVFPKNKGKTFKMDGVQNGKPYEQMGWFGGNFPTIFGGPSISSSTSGVWRRSAQQFLRSAASSAAGQRRRMTRQVHSECPQKGRKTTPFSKGGWVARWTWGDDDDGALNYYFFVFG